MPKAAPLRRSTRAKPYADASSSRRSTGAAAKATKPKPPKKTSKEAASTILSRTQQEIEGDPNRKLRLFTLPVELTQHISSFLSPAERICFTLTCKEAASVVGAEVWGTFKNMRSGRVLANGYVAVVLIPNRALFCELLLRDWGTWAVYCKICKTLHPDSMLPPRCRRRTAWTSQCLGQDAEVDYLPDDGERGYRLAYDHIFKIMNPSTRGIDDDEQNSKLETLRGELAVTKPAQNLTWKLDSSARYIDGKLILRHIHTFQNLNNNPRKKQALCAKQVLDLPVRLCPHQSTTTFLPERSRYIKTHNTNGPLLTHAIVSVFPEAQRKDIDMKVFRTPTKLEQEQMSATANSTYKCRSCPTQYRAELTAKGEELMITAWHCFGRDLLQASKYWKWFIRRTGYSLGTDKRNDEWWSQSRSYPDFSCE